MTSRTFGGEQTLPDLPGLVGSDLSEPDYIGVEAEKDRRETYKYIHVASRRQPPAPHRWAAARNCQ